MLTLNLCFLVKPRFLAPTARTPTSFAGRLLFRGDVLEGAAGLFRGDVLKGRLFHAFLAGRFGEGSSGPFFENYSRCGVFIHDVLFPATLWGYRQAYICA